MSYLHYKAINWNEIEDHLDHSTWEKLTSLFWLDTRIPVTNENNSGKLFRKMKEQYL